MKKMILCVLFLLAPAISQGTPIAIEFTGVIAQLFDGPGYLEEGHGAGGSIFVGGRGSGNIRGGATQFTVSQRTFIGFTLSDFFVFDDYYFGSAYDSNRALMGEFSFVFYNQTIDHEYWGTIPDRTSLIKQSSTISLYGDGVHENISSEYLDFWLDSGTYWLGIEGDYSRGLCKSSNIQFSGYTPVPEPATLALFSMELLFVYPKKKKDC